MTNNPRIDLKNLIAEEQKLATECRKTAKQKERKEANVERLDLRAILEIERKALVERRKLVETPADQPWFGIASSGGGIRSATINLGFLRTLNHFGILERADWLSTVSGGGYCGSFVQATTRDEGGFSTLFSNEKMQKLRDHGDYMIPGQGWTKRWNTFLLIVGYLVSLAMSLISLAIVAFSAVFLWKILGGLASHVSIFNGLGEVWSRPLEVAGLVILGLFGLHFAANVASNFDLDVSKKFNQIENPILFLAVIGWLFWSVSHAISGEQLTMETAQKWAIAAAISILFGYFANPNALSFHRYYRKQLADCYLQFSKNWRNGLLKDFFPIETGEKAAIVAPYPLINTCLNLQAPDGDEKFKGSKASDYFVLSPIFSGSKLTGYVPTASYRDFDKMTLPAAATISAAAVNPGMGIYSSKMLSILMTVFNARLGFWIANPYIRPDGLVWWPKYFFKELLSQIGTSNEKVNISDGGHIENLAVYELLRRRCRLIIGVDAGEDAKYQFFDLENLVVRARNELGLEIRFRHDQQPEDLMRPQPSHGYSRKRFAVADIIELWPDEKLPAPEWSENVAGSRKVGTFVYVKSSVMAPLGKPPLSEKDDWVRFSTYKYKIYHPEFPHEPTSDQFFDPIQWESYFQLGQHIGADVLGLDDDPTGYAYETTPKVSIARLVDYFDDKTTLFDLPATAADIETPAVLIEETEQESWQMGEGPAASKTATAPPPAATEPRYRM